MHSRMHTALTYLGRFIPLMNQPDRNSTIR